jgi:hypothetical protein
MEAKMIFVSEVSVHAERVSQAKSIWCQGHGSNGTSAVYEGELEPTRFLEFVEISDYADIRVVQKMHAEKTKALRPYLVSDWSQQIIELVEVVKAGNTLLPSTEMLQLRYIEVPLSVQEDYLAWRQETIFDVVRNASRVEAFSAYHAALSTQPGVLFLSGYSGDSKSYSRDVFETERYKQIVVEAGNRFIAGGAAGLYTRSYKRLETV